MNYKINKVQFVAMWFGCSGLSTVANAAFVDDAQYTLQMRNFYINGDYRSRGVAQSKKEEWAQGFLFTAQSGWTEGAVGFALEANASLGVKLDTGRSRSNTGLLPNVFGNTGPGEYSQLSGIAKVRYAGTQLQAGELRPQLPILTSSDLRLLPQTFSGYMLVVKDFEPVTLQLGHFSGTSYRASTNANEKLHIYTSTAQSDDFRYAAVQYKVSPSLQLEVWHDELENIYSQEFYNVIAQTSFKGWQWGASLGWFNNRDAGSQRAGNIDNQLATHMFSASSQGHTFRLGYQESRGATDFPQIVQTDVAMANGVMVLGFNRAHEQSWQARYDLDFAAYGVPGLRMFARYLHGDGFRVNGRNGKEWERNLDLSYTVQSGPLRSLTVRWRHASVRSDAVVGLDEHRLIIQYTYSFK
ncbi:OprD family outer membrane porin [Pseudomonas typographi]|uniref:OprD family porin n=1 Tax=Pseudomonas typographi TaxID=2715964 RepID=A0ABR7Z589_9PSED|nr:OprD family porin [Pseudomonas typographi]